MPELTITASENNGVIVGFISPQEIEIDNIKVDSETTKGRYVVRLEFGGRKMILDVLCSNKVSPGSILLTRQQIDFLGVNIGQKINIESVPNNFLECNTASEVRVKVYRTKFEETKCASDIETNIVFGDAYEKDLKKYLMSKVLHQYQKILYAYRGETVMLIVDGISFSTLAKTSQEMSFGVVREETQISVKKYLQNYPFRPGVDPDNLGNELRKLGTGGMCTLFTDLVGRLFKHRVLPPHVIAALKIPSTNVVLFYGPPGTGKTLIARNFCEIILCVTPVVFNGPYYGKSKNNIRKLFAPAMKDYLRHGPSGPLHVLIFDEFDGINQLDEVSELPNVLVLATTNRRDLIDPAILRSHHTKEVFVGFPAFEERLDILKLKLKQYISNGFVKADIDLNHLATLTKGFTGADLGSVVVRACSKALPVFSSTEEVSKRVQMELPHFEESIKEIKKKSGVKLEANNED